MWGQIASLGLGVASSVIGQVAAAQQAKKAEKALLESRKNLRTWYDNTKGDQTASRADMVELAKRTREMVSDRNRQALNPIANRTAEGQAAALDTTSMKDFAATASATAAQEAANNNKLYLQAENNINSQIAAVRNNQAAQITKAASQLTSAAGNAVQGFNKKAGSVDMPAAGASGSGASGSTGTTDNGSNATGDVAYTGKNLFDALYN